MDELIPKYQREIERSLEIIGAIVAWQRNALEMAKDMAGVYTRLPGCDPGPAKEFLKSLKTRPKPEPTDA